MIVIHLHGTVRLGVNSRVDQTWFLSFSNQPEESFVNRHFLFSDIYFEECRISLKKDVVRFRTLFLVPMLRDWMNRIFSFIFLSVASLTCSSSGSREDNYEHHWYASIDRQYMCVRILRILVFHDLIPLEWIVFLDLQLFIFAHLGEKYRWTTKVLLYIVRRRCTRHLTIDFLNLKLFRIV